MNFCIFLPLAFIILVPSAATQLLGCDDVQCPHNPNGMAADCQLGNITADNIGVANFTTSLSSQPLTWTIGQSQTQSNTSIVISRDFYLGQPLSLNIQLQSGTPDCGIFFHGIAPLLQFPGPGGVDQGPISGTCADALTLSCVEDLQNQVIEVLIANSTIDCLGLAAILQLKAPTSCPAQNGNWGEVSAKCELHFLTARVLI